MKIVPKLTLALVSGTCLVLAVNGYVRVKREVGMIEADRRRDHEMIGRSLGAAATSIWRSDGEAPAVASIDAVNRHFDRLHVRFLPWARRGEARVDAAELSAAPPGEPITTIAADGSHQVWLTYVPLEIAGAPKGVIELSEASPVERRFARSVAIDAVSTALALALFSALISFVMGQWLVGAPVRALASKARRIGRGELAEPLVLPHGDEFGLLADELNAMSRQLVSTLEQLRHADRLTTVGKLASGVAHELGTPLNVVTARASMIASGDTTPQESVDYARVIVGAADRMTKIIRQLLQFARRKGPQRATTDMRALVRDALSLLEPLASKRGVDRRLAPGDDDATANVEVGQMQQVITNLVMNAIQATPGGGHVDVDLHVERAPPPVDVGGEDRECLCLRVRDTGPGIPPDVLPHVFEPFFTTKGVGEGTGLGLAVTYGIIRDHGGWIGAVESNLDAPGRGAAFAVFLPRQASP